MNKIILLILAIMISNIVLAEYPPMIFREGVNNAKLINITKSIPEELFKGIKYIEFTNENEYSENDNYEYLGFYNYNYKYNKKTGEMYSFNNKRIKITANSYSYPGNKIKCVILHELGHHNELNKISHLLKHKNNTLSEDYANDFATKQDGECTW